MARHKHRMITVVGNIGSGKTTVTPVIAKALKAKHVFADNLFQTIDPFRELYLEDTKRWGLANELWLTLERVILVKKYLRGQKDKLLVVDSGLLMSWAYTNGLLLSGNMTEDEWNLYRRLFDKIAITLFASSVVVALDFPIKTLLKRIKQRGRQFELKYYNPEYLSRVDSGLTKLIEKLKRKKIPVIALGENDVVLNGKGEVEMSAALEQIKKLVKDH
ncbi:MAG TPA: deoxynucleoside kinase [Patescibacteria group bacterium]|nr:deoxynucleoside kinase [Patescibacteria group bacterium]